MFDDRVDAGKRLGAELAARGYGGRDDVVVLGVPRGGVEVAEEVARVLGAPLDIVVVRKIGAPGNPEYAAGAVDQDGTVYPNPEAHVSERYLTDEGRRQHAEALRRIAAYRAGRPEVELAGRVALVVDDGIATGLSALAALRWLRSAGATRVVLAVPVMSPHSARELERETDELVALEAPPGFYAVGAHYHRFGQLSDADVTKLLARATR